MTYDKRIEKTETGLGIRDSDGMDRWNRNAEPSGKIGAPKGNTNALKHGIYADRFLTPEEKPVFDAIIAQLHEDFVFNKSSDFIQVELVAVYFLKLGRAQEAGDYEAAERLDRMIRCHLKDLKTTKITREGTEPSEPQTTPAEWATALLEKLREAKENEVTDSEQLEEKRENDFA
ncbi:MAG: hypothetical protein ABFD49_07140 [Armatimonadota bacterium]|nr:hypothetical protein [bacterium]